MRRTSSIKVVLVISLILNVIIGVLLYNSYLINKDKIVGDSLEYSRFINRLERYVYYLDQAGKQTTSNEIMNSLINADKRLNLAEKSLDKFNNSMSATDLIASRITLIIEDIDEANFRLLSQYALYNNGEEKIADIKKSIDRLLDAIPKEYSIEKKSEFIKKINNLSY